MVDFNQWHFQVIFRRGGIGYWKTEFSQENLELFNSLSGDVLEKLNYEKCNRL